jgi:hypothetical protein
MHRSSSAFLSVLVALGLVLTGCDATGDSAGASGTLELRMSGASSSQTATRTVSTDMPNTPTASDVDTALVTIDQVSVVPAEDTSDGDSTEVGVQVLSDSNFTVDLKDLQAGLDTAMADIDVPAGTYEQVRLVTAGTAQVSFVDADGTQPVMIASGQQSGLKVNVEPFTIEGADDRVELTVNWDVNESLKGSSQGRYVITPVVHATATVTTVGN